MPEVTIPGIGDVTFPDDMSHDAIVAAIERDIIPQYEASIKPGGIGEAAIGGAKRLGSSALSAIQTPFLGAGEAAQRGLARQEGITERPGFSEEAIRYANERAGGGFSGAWAGAKEFLSQVPSTVAEQASNIGLSLAGARAGAMLPGPPQVKAVGALAGAFFPSMIPQFGSDIERQAKEDIAAKRPVDIDTQRALAAAGAQGALDVVGLKFGLGKLLGIPAKEMGTEAAEKIMQQNLLRAGTEGVAKTVFAEVPTEVAQQVLERWQAGLPLTSDDALAEYQSTALQTAAGIGPFGGINTMATRGEARQVLEDEAARKKVAASEIAQRQAGFQDIYARNVAQAQQDLADVLGREAVQNELDKYDDETKQRVVDTLAQVRDARNQGEVDAILKDEEETRQILDLYAEDERKATTFGAHNYADLGLDQPGIKQIGKVKKLLKEIDGKSIDDPAVAEQLINIRDNIDKGRDKGDEIDYRITEFLNQKQPKTSEDEYATEPIDREQPEPTVSGAGMEGDLRRGTELAGTEEPELQRVGITGAPAEPDIRPERSVYNPLTDIPDIPDIVDDYNAIDDFDEEAYAIGEELAGRPDIQQAKKQRKPPKRTSTAQAALIEPNATPSTTTQINDELQQMFSPTALRGAAPVVVDDYADLTPFVASGDLSAGDVAAAQTGAKAFVKGGTKDYYIANKIPSNYVRGTIMHERGGHIGLAKLIGQPRINALAKRIESMEKSTNEVEKRIAKEAIDLALDSGESIGTDRFNQEVIAYFTETAVNKYGIDPLKAQPKEFAKIAQWLKDLWTSVLNAVKKLHINPDTLTAKDIVDLVYGAARIVGMDGTQQGEVAGDVQASKAQTETPEFRRWFGNSKVVDENGQPLVVYRAGSTTQSVRGFFLTNAEWRASRYGKAEPYFVTLKNPYITDFAGNTWDDGDGDFNNIDDIAEYAKDNGFDGVIAYNIRGNPEDETTTEFVAFRPEQIKSAIGNIGQFDPNNPDIQASKRQSTTLSNDDLATLKAQGRTPIHTEAKQQTIKDTFFDLFGTSEARLKALDNMGTYIFGPLTVPTRKTVEAYGSNEMTLPSTGKELGVISAQRALNVNNLVGVMMEKGFPSINKRGVISVQDAPENLPALTKLATQVKDRLRDEGLSPGMVEQTFKEMVFADRYKALQAQGIKDQKEFGEGSYKNGKLYQQKYAAEYNAWRAMYNRWRSKFEDALVDSRMYTREQAQRLLNRAEYIPMYRLAEKDTLNQPAFLRNLSSAKNEQKLQEGTEGFALSDPMYNIANNMAYLTQRIINTNTANLLADQYVEMGVGRFLKVKPSHPTKPIVSFLRDGNEVFLEVDDPNDAVIFTYAPKAATGALRVLKAFSGLLRSGITLSPGFLYNQNWNDSMRVWGYTGTKSSYSKILGRSFAQQLKNWRGETPEFAELRKQGVVSAIDYQDSYNEMLNTILEGGRTDYYNWRKNPLKSAVRFMEHLAQNSDAASRYIKYKDALDQGYSVDDASAQAIMMLNYNHRGTGAAMAYLYAAAPFINTRIQGVWRLARALRGDIPGMTKQQAQRHLLWKMAKYTSFAMLYTMMSGDDNDDVSDERRWRNFLFRIGDTPLRVPVAPEMMLPKILVENSYRAALGKDENNELSRSIRAAVTNMLLSPSEGIPTVVQPILENVTNYSFFGQRPLIGASLAQRDVNQRYNQATSEFAKDFSNMLYEAAQAYSDDPNNAWVAVSPIKIENVLRGWFGTWGAEIPKVYTMTKSYLSESAGGVVEPTREFHQIPLIGSISFDPKSGIKEDFYDLADRVLARYTTANSLKQSPERYQAYAAEHRAELMLVPMVNAIKSRLSNLRQYRTQVLLLPETVMNADKKRSELDRISAMEKQLLEGKVKLIKQRLSEG